MIVDTIVDQRKVYSHIFDHINEMKFILSVCYLINFVIQFIHELSFSDDRLRTLFASSFIVFSSRYYIQHKLVPQSITYYKIVVWFRKHSNLRKFHILQLHKFCDIFVHALQSICIKGLFISHAEFTALCLKHMYIVQCTI